MRGSAAGQRVNFQKSALCLGPNVDDQVKNDIVQVLGAPLVEFHEKYLGLPTNAGKKRK